MLPCRRVCGNSPMGLLVTWILLQLTVSHEQTSSDTTSTEDNGADEMGSCFKERREQGNCFGLLSKAWSKAECCKRNGFFVNRRITKEEFFNDHLFFESGTPFCVEACYEEITPTCVDYRCPPGHTCHLVNNRPKCICHLSCTAEDYRRGPVCSSDLRKFKNKCLFKRAVCLFPMESLEEIACPEEAPTCAPDSVFLSQCMNMLQSFNMKNSPIQEENVDEYSDPWFLGELGKQLYNFGVGLFSKPSRIVRMRRRGYFVQPTSTGQYQRQGKRSGNSELQMSQYFGQLPSKINWNRCPAGEFCLIRQYDGRPDCIPLALTESMLLNDCPEEGIFPEPMCGVDNQTYTDACQLRNVSLKKRMEVRIAYRGSCHKEANCSSVRCLRDGMTCRPHHKTRQPVCMDCNNLPLDCNSYPQLSTMAEEAQGNGPENQLESEDIFGSLGDPQWNTLTETTNWPAICGSNGKTFPNSCFLHVFNCYSLEFVDFSMPGFCPGHL